MAKRKQIGKRKRFEVFKRDSFTCQYCGNEAPNVLLHVDHIKPVSKGGTNDITNLITSCQSCNLGKSNIELDDDSAIKKKKHQLDDLQERKNQLEMMAEWQKGLMDLEDQKAEVVNEIFTTRTDWGLSNAGKTKVRKLIDKFGLELVCKSTKISIDQYYKGTEASWNRLFGKIGGICYFKQTGQDKALRQAYYIKGIFDNRKIKYKFPIVKYTKDVIEKLGYDRVLELAENCNTASQYCERIDKIILENDININ